jgi:glycosyltransferase involved in cell wall biosynthesis
MWNKDTEIEDLLEMNLGLMPLLPDFKFAEGKCGFKAIQYMALEIPVIISPLGVNSEIVDHEKNGILCNNHPEWKLYLEKFMLHPESFKELGIKGRRTIDERYSVSANKNSFLNALVD